MSVAGNNQGGKLWRSFHIRQAIAKNIIENGLFFQQRSSLNRALSTRAKAVVGMAKVFEEFKEGLPRLKAVRQSVRGGMMIGSRAYSLANTRRSGGPHGLELYAKIQSVPGKIRL